MISTTLSEIRAAIVKGIGIALLCYGSAHANIFYKQNNMAVTEPLLRANLIVNLLRYVTWEQLNIDEDTPHPRVTLCIMGEPASMNELLKLNGASVNNREISLAVYADSVPASHCDAAVLGPHATTIGPSEKTLYICDDCAPETAFYAIKLIRIESKESTSRTPVKAGFEINLTQAKLAGITLGTDLLEHATK